MLHAAASNKNKNKLPCARYPLPPTVVPDLSKFKPRMASLAFEYPEAAMRDWTGRDAVHHPGRWMMGANRDYTLYECVPLPIVWEQLARPCTCSPSCEESEQRKCTGTLELYRAGAHDGKHFDVYVLNKYSYAFEEAHPRSQALVVVNEVGLSNMSPEACEAGGIHVQVVRLLVDAAEGSSEQPTGMYARFHSTEQLFQLAKAAALHRLSRGAFEYTPVFDAIMAAPTPRAAQVATGAAARLIPAAVFEAHGAAWADASAETMRLTLMTAAVGCPVFYERLAGLVRAIAKRMACHDDAGAGIAVREMRDAKDTVWGCGRGAEEFRTAALAAAAAGTLDDLHGGELSCAPGARNLYGLAMAAVLEAVAAHCDDEERGYWAFAAAARASGSVLELAVVA